MSGEKDMRSTSRPKWLVPAVAAGVAVIVVVAGVGGWAAWSARERSAASAACATAADHTREAMNAYNLLRDGDAAEASKTAKDQVKDANTLDVLSKALKAEAPEYAGCTADSVKGLKAAANTLAEQTTWYETHEDDLSKAVKAVNESKAAKTLDTARANLKAKLEEASKLLADSDGKVQDNAVRDVLSKAIDAGNKLVDGNDPSKLDEARTSLEDAVGKVNDSVKAKADADARAAAEAQEAAEAAAAAQAQASQSSGYGWTGGGWTGSSGSGWSGSSGSSGSGSGGLGGFPGADPNYRGQAHGTGRPVDGTESACNPVTGVCGIG
ncbi:colicin transporter [Bifidobacterium sp. UTBIF-68]|uniref:colicin transporter n=1 Tax=Bifidobacterium sp. UTBIF-68 TaxID=1465262 RepID=UPI00112CFA64|nr:colicin transporter [Bifidobacterium sp. UTBIF-68]